MRKRKWNQLSQLSTKVIPTEKTQAGHILTMKAAKILQRLVILGTLGMPDYGLQKRWYQLQGNFDSYLHAKN